MKRRVCPFHWSISQLVFLVTIILFPTEETAFNVESQPFTFVASSAALSLITDDHAFIAKLFGTVDTTADSPALGDETNVVTLGTSRTKFNATFQYTDANGNDVKIECVDCVATDHEFSNEAEGVLEESFSFNVKPNDVTITTIKKAV